MTDLPEPKPSPSLEVAHVLFMDIVAYSQLPMDEQTRLVGKLQQIVRATTEFARAQKRHQLLRLPTGDGMALVFFGNAEAPVRCAIEISRALRDNPELKLRMGVHTGPVQRVEDINANRNVAGGGINIAQRVMDCGDAGHILVSSAHAEVLGHLTSWIAMLHDLGEAEAKHGVRVHLYNLYNHEAGNPELPKKMSGQRAGLLETATNVRKKVLWPLGVGGVTAVVVALVGGWLLYAHRAHALTSTDTIVIADFANSTGDPVFDGALRQGLSAQLEQSPFLNLLSDQRIAQTLSLMAQPGDSRLTHDLAREVCQRTASAAVLDGSIAQIGTEYLLTLKAVNCSNGESLASTQAQATDKNHVLDALGKVASEIRRKVGESLASVQKYDEPPDKVTTPSLEALKAYTLGYQTMVVKADPPAAVSLFQRAISLDPNFAMAYARLGICYSNLNETARAAEYTRKAYQLRERVSEREKLYIASHYDEVVTGNLEAARRTHELWAQTYPRDNVPPHNLGIIYAYLGNYGKSLAASQEVLKLNPGSGSAYATLVTSYLYLNRLDEAKTTVEEAQAHNLDSPFMHLRLYSLDFLRHNTAGMEQEVAELMGKPGYEDEVLYDESDTAAFFGHFAKARGLALRAVESAQRADKKETAAGYEAEAALREALVGNMNLAKQQARAALALSKGRDVAGTSAIALGWAGDSTQAAWLASDLDQRFPEDTIAQFNYSPTIRAAVALRRSENARAVAALAAATPYELGIGSSLYPVYLRGEAYLRAKQGTAAAVEFQKIVDHPGVVANGLIGALARLQLGRACALSGDLSKTRTAYQDFLTLWKDGDSDIPILKQARAEYAKLQ